MAMKECLPSTVSKNLQIKGKCEPRKKELPRTFKINSCYFNIDKII